MIDVLVAIELIKWLANDVHYRSSDEWFYALHLLADKVNFGDSVDALKEAYYLGMKEENPPSDSDVNVLVVDKFNGTHDLSNKDLLRSLYDACAVGILAVEQAKREPGLIAGVHAILDSVSQTMLVIKGLCWRSLNGETTREAV